MRADASDCKVDEDVQLLIACMAHLNVMTPIELQSQPSTTVFFTAHLVVHVDKDGQRIVSHHPCSCLLSVIHYTVQQW